MVLSEEKTEELSVRKVTNKIIQKIESQYGSQRAAILANLRNTIGKSLTDAENVWPLMFENMPQEFLSKSGEETQEEKAIFTTLQLYAMCMQGASGNVKSDSSYKGSIGASLKSGRSASDSEALDRRFNVLITADTFSELTYHLRQIIKIVKSKGNIAINFPKLADDLLWFQRGRQKRICLRWAQEYYSQQQKATDSISKEENIL
ncbi:MAG: type I-E CRISPR-associated protein Cse2/CasB [Lachnospiraceae bacterium]|jgi:CRISPR system Cascade subunit CasB|nr:type I-E CRISPR-associated protein Cse2/CasB [Lachnospiraceae bacterium]MCH4070409.1 type I-E CRISPR-associated protein Cse2/CasB [Lachnospiraceae bacterium]MCI1430128.1 type I-E CRISPR-associated protein Cse2/CasB [Lachnospiraceae bacterium]MCI1555291.1 type I-E CRISPR-associated protein Cse2/CasB [Lachnospiraceae bacterium]